MRVEAEIARLLFVFTACISQIEWVFVNTFEIYVSTEERRNFSNEELRDETRRLSVYLFYLLINRNPQTK